MHCWHPSINELMHTFHLLALCAPVWKSDYNQIYRTSVNLSPCWCNSCLMSVQHFDCAKYRLFLNLRTSAACTHSRLYTFHLLCLLLESSIVMSWWGMLCDSCLTCHHVTSIYLFSWVCIIINCIHLMYLIGWKHAWRKLSSCVSFLLWNGEMRTPTVDFPLSLKYFIFTAWM